MIPVLVDGADMPDHGELPKSIQSLARRNAVRVDYETFRADVGSLLETIKRAIPIPVEKPSLQDGVAGAQAAYQRAMHIGDPDEVAMAAFSLGVLLAEQGDVAGARAAYQQVMSSGHRDHAPAAAHRLEQLK